MRKHFKNSIANQKRFKQALKVTHIPPAPSDTRWQSTIKATEFIADHFDSIIEFFKRDQCTSAEMKTLISDEAFLKKLKSTYRSIKKHFSNWNTLFNCLQGTKYTLAEGKIMMRDVEHQINRAVDKSRGTFLEQGMVQIQKYAKSRIDKLLEEIGKLSKEVDYDGSPLSNAECERVFSLLKSILTPGRSRLYFSTVRCLLIRKHFLLAQRGEENDEEEEL